MRLREVFGSVDECWQQGAPQGDWHLRTSGQ